MHLKQHYSSEPRRNWFPACYLDLFTLLLHTFSIFNHKDCTFVDFLVRSVPQPILVSLKKQRGGMHRPENWKNSIPERKGQKKWAPLVLKTAFQMQIPFSLATRTHSCSRINLKYQEVHRNNPLTLFAAIRSKIYLFNSCDGNHKKERKTTCHRAGWCVHNHLNRDAGKSQDWTKGNSCSLVMLLNWVPLYRSISPTREEMIKSQKRVPSQACYLLVEDHQEFAMVFWSDFAEESAT